MNLENAWRRLRKLRNRLASDALDAGRYGPPYTAERFDDRDKSAAFRSMGYQRLVRDIKAIDMVLDDHNAKRVRKCDVCGGDADADDWCYGCGHHVCVECVERHGHIGSGVHGGIGAMEATS